MIYLIDTMDYKLRTNDDKFSQSQLINKICRMVGLYNTSNDSNDDISNFIIKSFTINGIITIYNEVGLEEWISILTQMIQHEVYERSKQ